MKGLNSIYLQWFHKKGWNPSSPEGTRTNKLHLCGSVFIFQGMLLLLLYEVEAFPGCKTEGWESASGNFVEIPKYEGFEEFSHFASGGKGIGLMGILVLTVHINLLDLS